MHREKSTYHNHVNKNYADHYDRKKKKRRYIIRGLIMGNIGEIGKADGWVIVFS